ncbi:hypothetical protein Vadar_012318 [Vaccinium darrowii]|uniref:Uncharacterized protein n=1 Tax=Vaccinium darrowii TaxID=229202 RepID=A0ACB7YX21_9ERIC|nr:hypothetical protein Vadar_012318 [Vaccinium darrowii]
MGPKKSTKIRRGKRPDTSTKKPKRIAPAKKRRHASPVTSSQNSCTGEAYPRKLAVRPVEMALPWHPLGVHYLSSSSDDLELLNMLQLLSPSSSSSEEDERSIPIGGQEYTTSLLNGDPDTMRETLRVDARTFRALVKLLSEQGGSHWDHMRLSVAESLAIFLYICGQGKWFQGAADRFQHSTDTISEHFKYMMRALRKLAPSVIQPPDLNEIPVEILHDNKYYPWFENCVGAIGGTLVESWVPGSHEVTGRGRKVDKSQKVMAVCSFDEKFTYVYSGWEGYARNSVVFGAMVSNPRNMFPNPPANKYYLNWVLIQRGRDEFFEQIGEEVGHGSMEEGYSHIYMSSEAMATTRDEIAGAMWEAYANGN